MMTQKQLIQKWLDYDLTKSEEIAFLDLEDYAELEKLSQTMKRVKPPIYDIEAEFLSLQNSILEEPKTQKSWKKLIIPIAAILVISFGIFKFSNNQLTTIKTIAAQKENVILPDDSEVILNTNSEITFSENDWGENRKITLKGEGFFNVAKGQKFVVESRTGKVTVLGTQFNIQEREGFFEVVCFEGLVQVDFKGKTEILKPGEIFSSETGLELDSSLIDKRPSWVDGKSTFKSKQYKYVLAEFERQYNLKVNVLAINTTQLFTGSFPHDNLEKAIQAITMPLRIKATNIDLKTIQLSSE